MVGFEQNKVTARPKNPYLPLLIFNPSTFTNKYRFYIEVQN
ncbi:MAG: hypothetical protein AVDCRST_MAG56-700 [uncultured Cytophagales bacterium]|uniref:Uncharacterized protein n=1 Tax=uncultured Cytophagales bacterium TaxID=158755 RepID=A0A6J4HLJ8_9SPHI|nr:MAG: hypothetical protein AVDCRST_MAG56-700 [uncultured Cytophagales bacterium]